MAFGRLANKHDSWLVFCNRYRSYVDESGLPKSIILSENRFRDLLREGVVQKLDIAISLAELSEAHWNGLKRFVDVFIYECESFLPSDLFPAYFREAKRRNSTSTT